MSVLAGVAAFALIAGLIALSYTSLIATTCVALGLLIASVVVVVIGRIRIRGARGCATLGLVPYMIGAAALAATGAVVLLATYLLHGALA